MRCPSCQYNGTRVVDSRPVDDNKAIRRRRECEDCGSRFTTLKSRRDAINRCEKRWVTRRIQSRKSFTWSYSCL